MEVLEELRCKKGIPPGLAADDFNEIHDLAKKEPAKLEAMTQLFDAHAHWGKYFPLGPADVAAAYPRLAEFRALCNRVDPHGVFRNEFTSRVLFGS